MLLTDVAATALSLATTRSKKAKTARLATTLGAATAAELPIVVAWLSGTTSQSRLGVGWVTVFRDLADAGTAEEPSLDVVTVDSTLTAIADAAGPGSATLRRSLLSDLFDRATATEATFLRALLVGEIRIGSLTGLMTEAIAAAFEVPLGSLRRASMLTGDLGEVAVLASAGAASLEAVGLRVGRPLQPMLASTAADVDEAIAAMGTASVEWKLDGARIQVHRDGDDIRVFTRNLNDITHRLPAVTDAVRALPATRLVLDGEVLGLDADGNPQPFQDTISTFAADEPGRGSTRRAPALTAFFFDILHRDGEDLLTLPLSERLTHLDAVAAALRVPGVVTDDPDTARALEADALARGHEGVVVKAIGAPYEAGRRGATWRKVKPVRTFDLVVLAVEWGSGRRRGWLSNIHLGALDPATGELVMVGKTFKGMTDEMLRWQTARFLALESGRSGHVVRVRPEVVAEIAIDGVQRSGRYPGGVALRFARVKRYREDKRADEADPITSLQALLPPG